MISKCILFLSLIVLVRSQESTTVGRCSNSTHGDNPINVWIEGCVTPPCDLPQLQDAVVNVVFRAPRLMKSMKTKALAFLLIFPIDYDLEENSETCNFLENTYCPIAEGEIILYTLRMYIQPYFPVGTQLPVDFRVEDENELPVFCFRVNIRITRPLEPTDPLPGLE